MLNTCSKRSVTGVWSWSSQYVECIKHKFICPAFFPVYSSALVSNIHASLSSFLFFVGTIDRKTQKYNMRMIDWLWDETIVWLIPYKLVAQILTDAHFTWAWFFSSWLFGLLRLVLTIVLGIININFYCFCKVNLKIVWDQDVWRCLL